MKILSSARLEGPNVWSPLPVWVARVDFSGWDQLPQSARIEAAVRLGERFPKSIRDRHSGQPVSGIGFQAVVPQPAYRQAGSLSHGAAQLLLDVMRALHTLSRRTLEFTCVRPTPERGVYLIAVECEEAALSNACLEFACILCNAEARGETVDVTAGIERLCDLADDICLGTTTGALVAAARQRGIPVRRLDPTSLVQLGHGAHQRRLQTAVTDQTGKIAEAISLDKDLTKALLRQVGVPTPEGRPVADREDAWTAACELGLPVVVKPRNGDYGLGVSLNLQSREQTLAAYDSARQFRDEVLVERFAAGEQYRVTVVGERLVAAVRRVPPQVTGDGTRTVAELIEQANRDPRRGDDEFAPLNRIAPDEDTLPLLAEQGCSLETVPAAGRTVTLSRLAHTWAGGEVEDVTDTVHPEVAALCVRAARVIGLDVAGLDLVAVDLQRPLDERGGVILEVNAGPAIALHFAPFCPQPRPVCEAILELLFPPGQSGRIPVVLICDDYQSRTGQLLEQSLSGLGRRIGRASWDGIHVGGARLKAGPFNNTAGARAVLMCPDVELAILEQSSESIRNEGLAVDRCDAAILAGLHDNGSPELESVVRLLRDAADSLLTDVGIATHHLVAAALSPSLRPAA